MRALGVEGPSVLSVLGRVATAAFRSSPIFIVGVGRSGTTVVLRALGAHPQVIATVSEAPFMVPIGAAAEHMASGETVEYRLKTLRTPLSYTHERLRRVAFESAMGAHFGIRRVVGEFARSRKSPFGIRRWCTKTFPSAEVAHGLEQLYPNVRYVYVFRNGLDVVQSRTRFEHLRDRAFETHCREWADAAERYAYLLSSDRATPVRHEELIADPDGVFDRVVESLELSRNSKPAAYAKSTLVHPLDQPTETDVSVQERLSSRAAAYEEWTDHQRDTFKMLCGDAMRTLGYEVPF